jgi:hypothetical protein
MRNQPPFSCPQCGDTGLGGDRCLRCKIELVDAAGHPALAPPAVFFSRPTFSGFTWPWARWLAAGAGIISMLTVAGDSSIPWWTIIVVQVALWGAIGGAFLLVDRMQVKRHRQRSEATRARVASASPVAAIGQCNGLSHIRGRVHVVKPVKGPNGDPVAAYLVRRQKDTVGVVVRDRWGQTNEIITSITVEEVSACGVFLVKDDTGAALVDDDAFTVSPLAAGQMAWDRPLSLVVKEGDEVEIIGPTERKPSSAFSELAQSGGYREAGTLLVFNGTPAERVLILSRESGIVNG